MKLITINMGEITYNDITFWGHDTQHNDSQRNDDTQQNNKYNATFSTMADCCYSECHK